MKHALQTACYGVNHNTCLREAAPVNRALPLGPLARRHRGYRLGPTLRNGATLGATLVVRKLDELVSVNGVLPDLLEGVEYLAEGIRRSVLRICLSVALVVGFQVQRVEDASR